MIKRVEPKTILKIAVSCGIIIALILFLPFPSRVNFSHSGFRLHRDLSEEQITMTVKGWHWRSLTGVNRLNGMMEITDSSSTRLVHEFGSMRLAQNIDLITGALDRYDPQLNGFVPRSIYASKNLDTFIAINYSDGNSNNFEMASADSSKSVDDTLAFFRSHVWIDFD